MTFNGATDIVRFIDGIEFRKYEDRKYPEYFVYVSFCGKVFDPIEKEYKKIHDNGNGYKTFVRWIKELKVSKLNYYHRVVAETWIPNPDNKPTVNHIDGDKTNNHGSNLEWSTHSEQTKHGVNIGAINLKGRGWQAVSYKEVEKIAQGLFLGKGTMEISRAIGRTRGTINSVKKSKNNGTIVRELVTRYEVEGFPEGVSW